MLESEQTGVQSPSASGIPRLYFIEEIAEVWQVSVKFLADGLRSGKFRGVKAGRRWAMTEEQMAENLDAMSNRPKLARPRSARETETPKHAPGVRPLAFSATTRRRLERGEI